MNCLQHFILTSSIYGESQQQKQNWVSSTRSDEAAAASAITGSVGVVLSQLVLGEENAMSPPSATGLHSGMCSLTRTTRSLFYLVKNIFHSFVASVRRLMISYAKLTLYKVTKLKISKILVHAIGPHLKLSTCLTNSPVSNLHWSVNQMKKSIPGFSSAHVVRIDPRWIVSTCNIISLQRYQHTTFHCADNIIDPLKKFPA